MLLIGDNFVKSLVISIFSTKLTTFFNIYENIKTTYSKIQSINFVVFKELL